MRIVSLLPSGAERVAALGLVDDLFGISHECDFPPAVTNRSRLTRSVVEASTSPAEIDAAVARAALSGRPLCVVDGSRLASLKPDLIVTQGVCAVTPATGCASRSRSLVASTCPASPASRAAGSRRKRSWTPILTGSSGSRAALASTTTRLTCVSSSRSPAGATLARSAKPASPRSTRTACSAAPGPASSTATRSSGALQGEDVDGLSRRSSMPATPEIDASPFLNARDRPVRAAHGAGAQGARAPPPRP
jgi:hypothetical protein